MSQQAFKVFAETASGQLLPVGTAQVEQHQGRDMLRVTLDAAPTSGKLCIPLADLDVLRSDAKVAGHA